MVLLILRKMEGDSIASLVEQVWPTAESMGLSKDLVYAAAEIKVGL